ncbi:hypothetical protein G7054_g10983 [Neopestalotiopsis clavispora]|nr:hypothetical protein G7054_g10983 [Neopestalotiopsis clavispora]
MATAEMSEILPEKEVLHSNAEFQQTAVSTESGSTKLPNDDTEHDPNEVDWDGLDDVAKPQNWPAWRRGWIFGIVMALNFSTSLASSAIAPAVPALLAEYHSSDELAGTLIITIELMGTAIGPLLLAPLSELYGRQVVYNIANLSFCAFTVGCALSPSPGALVALRFLQGCAASCAVNNAGGTIGDIVPTRRRGAAMSLFSVSILFGPVVGPIAGSYLAAAAGWRWIFWLLLIMETYEPVLLERKVKKLRKETGNAALYAKGTRNAEAPSVLLKKAIVRPIKMLCLCPLITGLSLYISVAYGFTYLLFSTFSKVFQEQYHYSDGNLGLAYLGLAGGMLVGLSVTSALSDRTYLYLTKKHGVEKPEYRLETLIWGAIASPIGFFFYGWTAQYQVFSAVPIIATAFVGFGVLLTFIPIQVYMIDAYTKYAASAIAASSLLRSIAGALVPLAGDPM